jgi:hypothetical protein
MKSHRLHRVDLFAMLGIFLLAAGMGTTTRAWGGDFTEAHQRLATEARKACLAGDYTKGVAILADLFVETRHPLMIFNQGRCFEQNGHYEEAISRFEEYLRVAKDTDAKDRSEAQSHVADCRAKLESSRLLGPPSATSSPGAPPRGEQGQVTAPPSVERHVQSEPGSNPGTNLRLAGIVVGAAGVAALGTAVVLNLKANSLANELNSPTGFERSKLSDRSSYRTMSMVAYGVGSACLIGGAVLYGIGATRSRPSTVAVLPTLAPGYASLNLQGAF